MEFGSDVPVEDCSPMVLRSWGLYNKALTMRMTQAKFNKKEKAILTIHEHDRHY